MEKCFRNKTIIIIICMYVCMYVYLYKTEDMLLGKYILCFAFSTLFFQLFFQNQNLLKYFPYGENSLITLC